MGSIDTNSRETNHTTLLFDIRNHDEIDTIRYKNDGTTDVLYMPANIIKYNLEFLHEYFKKYKQVYIICQSGNRSKIIKDKYFSEHEHVMINSIHFNKFNHQDFNCLRLLIEKVRFRWFRKDFPFIEDSLNRQCLLRVF